MDDRRAPRIGLMQVAGIVHMNGAVRVVATSEYPHSFIANTGPEELCLVVPDYCVPDPIPWQMIPEIIKRTDDYVAWWMTTRNDPDDLRHPAIKRFLARQRGD